MDRVVKLLGLQPDTRLEDINFILSRFEKKNKSILCLEFFTRDDIFVYPLAKRKKEVNYLKYPM